MIEIVFVQMCSNWLPVSRVRTALNKPLPQSNVHLIHKGDKVGASEATLLQMLDVKPFAYGLIVENIYDNGAVFAPEVLDITG